jgi:hypothetical protein
MPILAAAIGVAGGVGGALVGAFAANKGQEEGFKRERLAATQDLRTEAYGTFFGTAEEVGVVLQSDDAPNAEIRAAFRKLNSAKARVFLVADDPGVGPAAFAAAKALETANDASNQKKQQRMRVYYKKRDRFLEVARDEMEKTQK